MEKPDITQLNEILKKYIDNHKEKYDLYQVCCAIKVNDNQQLTCKPMLNLNNLCNPNIIIEIQPCFSQVVEMRITFNSSHRHMTYDCCSNQPMPMCEFE